MRNEASVSRDKGDNGKLDKKIDQRIATIRNMRLRSRTKNQLGLTK